MPTDRLTAALAAAELQILSVGSGDGSQQAAIVARGHRNITTTFLDPSRDAVLAKYPGAAAHLDALALAAGPTLFGVDATRLVTAALGGRKFDIVMFTFPHTGARQSDSSCLQHSIDSNRQLLRGFLRSVTHVLEPGGEVQITLKTTAPYSEWGLSQLLSEDCHLRLSSQHDLDKAQYPGYVHRLTAGTSGSRHSVSDDDAQVYVFSSGATGAAAAAHTPAPAPAIWLGDGTRVTIVVLAPADAPAPAAADDDGAVTARVLEVLRAAGVDSQLTVLDIRRQIHHGSAADADRAPRTPGGGGRREPAAPDTRQLNRVLYSLENRGTILKGAPVANGRTSKKPTWRLMA